MVGKNIKVNKMAVEGRRGCGYRKVGGTYLVSDGPGYACGRLPILLEVCRVCGAGVKQSRGWTWVEAEPLIGGKCNEGEHECHTLPGGCKVCDPAQLGRSGLMWVGKKFYTPHNFIQEAVKMGISKRISAIPKDFELGKTWVLLAHPEAAEKKIEDDAIVDDKKQTYMSPEGYTVIRAPGIFYAFKPTRIEKLITESQSTDEKEMEALKKRNIIAVIVPDNDPDHKGTVYGKKGKLNA